MILPCTCQHKDQDKRYGDGMRVYNECKGDSGSTPYRCTVCENEKSISTGSAKK